jgi:DNA-directed RNA polymerase III subunit RPC8
VYIWRNDGTELYFDRGDIVRFRVEREEWHDQSLLAPPAKGDTTSEIESKVPYSIIVSLFPSLMDSPLMIFLESTVDIS